MGGVALGGAARIPLIVLGGLINIEMLLEIHERCLVDFLEIFHEILKWEVWIFFWANFIVTFSRRVGKPQMVVVW